MNEETRAKNAARSKAWREKNPDYMKKYMKSYRDQNGDAMREADRQYHAANKEKRNAGRREWARQNPEKDKEATQRWRQENPEIVKNYNLKRYGITVSDYNRLLETQEARCAICRSDRTHRQGSRYFHVDHDHRTGRVRGLLCHRCNTLIGLAKEDHGVLMAAIAYLDTDTQSPVVSQP